MKLQHIGLLLAGLLFAGCSELEQIPESTASKNSVFSSERGLELYANSFYDNLPTANDIIRSDEMADFAARTQVPDLIRDGAYGPRQSSGWTWTALRNINYFIENATNPAIPADVRRHYIGVARFFAPCFTSIK